MDELVAIVHAAMQVRVIRRTRELTFRATTRGMIRERGHKTSGELTVEQIVVLHWRDGVPWLLRPSEARFVALGAAVRPTVHENFRVAVEWLRARAPNAIYDDRFVTQPLVPQRNVRVRDYDAAAALSNDRRVEHALHALGTWLGRGRGGPYRG